MTFEQIQQANEAIRTTNIKGKEYAEVNQRIKAFRMLHPEGEIFTEILNNENGVVIMKATVADKDGQILGVGHAYEKESSSYINKTSYIENCETSAVGRALGMLGIGIDTSVASYEEVANAMHQQSQTENLASDLEKKTLKDRCRQLNVSLVAVLRQAGMTDDEIRTGRLTNEHHGRALIILKEIEDAKNEQNEPGV